MNREGWTPGRWRSLQMWTLLVLLGVVAFGCEIGWQDTEQRTLDQVSAVAAATSVASWAADSSDCGLQVVSVSHVKQFGPLPKLSEEIADNTPVLDGRQGCDDILVPSQVQEQDVYPTGSRSDYRSVVEAFLDASPTDAEHVVRVDWNSPNGRFSTLTAVNADSLKVLFSPVGTVLGSDIAEPESIAQRVDTSSGSSSTEATWRPEGEDTEQLVWQDSLSTELEGVGTLPVDHGQVLAETAPEMTLEWNSDAQFSEANCTIDGSGLVSNPSIDAGVSTSDLNRQLVKTDVRAEWRDDTCVVVFQVDIGVTEGNATPSAREATNGPGFEISKSGIGQLWTFRRSYEWGLTQ